MSGCLSENQRLAAETFSKKKKKNLKSERQWLRKARGWTVLSEWGLMDRHSKVGILNLAEKRATATFASNHCVCLYRCWVHAFKRRIALPGLASIVTDIHPTITAMTTSHYNPHLESMYSFWFFIPPWTQMGSSTRTKGTIISFQRISPVRFLFFFFWFVLFLSFWLRKHYVAVYFLWAWFRMTLAFIFMYVFFSSVISFVPCPGNRSETSFCTSGLVSRCLQSLLQENTTSI